MKALGHPYYFKMAAADDLTEFPWQSTNQIAGSRSCDGSNREGGLFDMSNTTWVIPPLISTGYSTREGPSENKCSSWRESGNKVTKDYT